MNWAVRVLIFGCSVGSVARAADPPSAPARAAAPTPAPVALFTCLSGQRCGDHCIAWSELCTAGLADLLGLPEPRATAPGEPPAGVPAGSTLLNLPRLVPATGPSMRSDAPGWCTEDGALSELRVDCMSYYQLGSEGSALAPTPAPGACPQHLQCAGVCLPPGEPCPATEPNASARLQPYDAPEPAPLFR